MRKRQSRMRKIPDRQEYYDSSSFDSEQSSESRDDNCRHHCSEWKGHDLEDVIKCEADFFCEVLHRLTKELHRAYDMNDLNDIIDLSAKFLLASAAKEKSIACQISATKGDRQFDDSDS